MKCPKCGTRNGEANRFCRSCGTRIEGLIEPEPKATPETGTTDEVALGERLFEVWQLYSAGELDRALEMIQQAKQEYPDSASVNSLAALVYERKAEAELDAGNVEAAKALLDSAVGQYERIVGFTPEAAADRERLASLKKRVRAQEPKRAARAVPAAPPAWVGSVKEIFGALPWYAFAAAGAFMLVIIVAIVAWPSGAPKKRTEPARPRQTVAARPNTAPAPPPATPSAPPLRVYTFPAPPVDLSPAPPPAPPPQEPPKPKPEAVRPVQLPPLPQVRVVSAKNAASASTQPARPAAPRNTATNGEAAAPPEPANPDGATLFARAISLGNQGRTQEAVAAAQQAIVLFEREAVTGNNPTAANRGAENARKMISIWQSSNNGTSAQ